MDIFKKLKELNFPLGEYVVVGSGILSALNIRESNDLDIAISEKLLEEIINSEDYTKEIMYDRLFLKGKDMDIITQLDWDKYPTTTKKAIETAEIINGFPFLNIKETILFKKAMGREKDLKDIDLLNEYLS